MFPDASAPVLKPLLTTVSCCYSLQIEAVRLADPAVWYQTQQTESIAMLRPGDKKNTRRLTCRPPGRFRLPGHHGDQVPAR